VFEQQGPQHVGPVLRLDLVRDDHLLHHLVGDAREGLLVQVQQNRTWDRSGGRERRTQEILYPTEDRLHSGRQ